MVFRIRYVLAAAVIAGSAIVGGDLVGQKPSVRAQELSRGSGADDVSRERGRGRFRGSDRERGSRGASDGSDSRRAEQRDNDSGSSNRVVPRGESSASTSSASPSPKANSATPVASMNMTDYARSLVKQYDKNGDMMLQPEERKELRGRATEADLNKDNVITIDELVAHLSSDSSPSPNNTPAASPPPAPASGSTSASSRGSDDRSKSKNSEADQRVFTGSAGGLAADAKHGDKRRSYRFTPATERLPDGLPSWFRSRDANRDGQVQMSEYGRSWTKSLVAEFRRYDLNDDGTITPKEAAKKP